MWSHVRQAMLMLQRKRWLDYSMLVLIGVGGYAGAPAWFILLAAAGLSLDEWAKLWGQAAAGETPSSKAVTYAVTGAIACIGYSAFAYLAGAAARAAL